jgi:hypothetical protein
MLIIIHIFVIIDTLFIFLFLLLFMISNIHLPLPRFFQLHLGAFNIHILH